jgi:hypothetical protein
MSGYSEDAVVEHRVGQQLASLLRKPFTPSELDAKVRELLDHR